MSPQHCPYCGHHNCLVLVGVSGDAGIYRCKRCLKKINIS